MTEGEVCLDYAKMAETQRQTQLNRAPAVKKALFKRKRNSWFQDEGRLAIIGAEFRSHLGNVGYIISNARIEGTGFVADWSLEAGIRELICGYKMLNNVKYSNV